MNKNGFCPILSQGKKDIVCCQEKCAWWDNDRCIVSSIHGKLSRIAYYASESFDLKAKRNGEDNMVG